MAVGEGAGFGGGACRGLKSEQAKSSDAISNAQVVRAMGLGTT